MATKVIESNTPIDTEQYFLVKAGPGAGKTYWLIQHIKHVLATSNRLGKMRKIGCITYTNIGVRTIHSRLSNSADRVDVCTIHSFLYDNIIRPYFHFIAAEEGFAIDKLKVVDDTIMADWKTLDEIKRAIKKRYYDDDILKHALSLSTWRFDKGELKFKPPHPVKISGYSIAQMFYDEYKKHTWGRGVMHYDDVLYFAYKLMEKFPFIAHVINAKYPYIFIDEFQDSTPVQVEILKKIASTNFSVIGVIGDKAQAIYGFAGTDPKLFDKFSLNEMRTYIIQGNRRSSKEIIDLLNKIRSDLPQYSVNNIHSDKPVLYVGDAISCYNEFKRQCGNTEVVTLSYAKVTSNALRKQMGQIPQNEDLFNTTQDANWKRVKMLRNSVTAIEYGLAGAIKDALKEMKKIVDDEHTQIKLLSRMLKDYDTYKSESLEFFLKYLKENLRLDVSRLNKGKAKDFYSSKTYSDFALYISSPDIKDLTDKTIHKAKGDEFDNVMVVLGEELDIKFLTNPKLDDIKDEQRVYYVAISRAAKRLAICVPTLSQANENTLAALPIDIKRV